MTPALSPSRAGDFKTCPLLYRYKVVDRLPEVSGGQAVRGTIVHAVLERLVQLPSHERTWEACRRLSEEVVTDTPPGDLAQMTQEDWAAVAECLATYGRLEDPRRVPLEATELRFNLETEGGTPIRGFIDRVDRDQHGRVRIVDYKTGKLPREAYAGKALFQMKLYALAWWLRSGELANRLQLYYLAGDGGTLTYDVESVAELQAFARVLDAMWKTILRLGETGDFRPKPNPLCGWCSFQAHCPAKGGELLPYPGWPGTETGPSPRGVG